jgi:tetratricopeptide (TPR) repeat protein
MSDSRASASGHNAYTRGLLCYHDDLIDRASDAFREAVGSGDPEWGPKAELQLAMILRERGDADGAERAYRQVIDASHGPEAGPALANLGALLVLRNDPASAKEVLDRAVEVCAPTERAGAAYNLGEMAREQGEIDGAKRLFELAIESSKDTTPQGDDMLDALEAAGRTTDALNRKNELSENRVGGGAAAAEQLAKLLMKQGNQSGALESFRQVMAFGHPEVTLRAEAELAGPLLPADEARKFLQEAIDSGDPRWGPAASANLGFLLEQEGDLEGAKEAYRGGAESTDPVIGPQAARYLGDLQAQQGDLAGARESYRRAMESDGEDGVGAASSFANLLAASGDIKGLREAIALAHPPLSPAAALSLGELLEDRGEIEEAKDAYKQAISSGHPDLAPAGCVNLGMILENEHDFEGAKTAFQQAIDSGHPDWSTRGAGALGVLLERTGDIEGAKVAYRKAAESTNEEVVSVAEGRLRSLEAGNSVIGRLFRRRGKG